MYILLPKWRVLNGFYTYFAAKMVRSVRFYVYFAGGVVKFKRFLSVFCWGNGEGASVLTCTVSGRDSEPQSLGVGVA